MDDDLYKNALSAFNRGEYESAYNIISCTEESLSIEGERLLNECEKQIAEQYYYIIKEYLHQGDYNTARREKDKYAKTYGYNPKIESIEIPTKSNLTPSMEDSTEFKNGNTEQKSALKNIGLIVGIITVVLISIIIAVYQYTDNEDAMPIPQQAQQEVENSATKHYHTQSTTNIYEQRSNAIIQELTTKHGNRMRIIGKYPDLSRHVAFMLKDSKYAWEENLVVCDVKTGKLVTYDFPLRLPTGSDRCGTPTKVFDSLQKDKLLIIGENAGNCSADMAFLLEIDPSNWNVREINWGLELDVLRDKIKIVRRFFTRWDEETGERDWADIDFYYDLQGKLIAPPYNGNTYNLKGQIDNRYAVSMHLSIRDNKIYGKYYYDKNGSGNYLQLYGGVSDSGDVVLLEFNDKSQQTSNFIGRFTKNSFYGTFTNYKQIEMPFELYLNDGLDTKNNSESVSDNSQKTGYDEKTKEPSLTHDRNPEFPGGMSNLKKYISENIIYPTVAQENGISGNVRVSYIINEDGSISDVKVIESIDPYLDKEAVRVISSMPKWSPGIKDGQYVSMRTSSLVKFVLK